MPDHPRSTPTPSSPEVRSRRFNVSLVWLVPIVAALIGLSMVVHKAMSVGPQIVVTFLTAEGLEANKTQVKYKNVVIGKVTAIALSDDRAHIDATIELDQSAAAFTTRDTRFWVVRPRIGAGGVSGVDTLLSGAFIGADPGEDKETGKNFVGLENPPAITYGQKGKRFTLHTADLGSLDIGSAVYYRRIQVGQVVSYQLAGDGKGVDIDIFVNAPNDQYVRKDSRFWNASGVDVSLGANGLKVNTQSVASILAGGVAFIEPNYSVDKSLADERAEFTLFDDLETALARPDGEGRYVQMRFDQSLRGLTVNAAVEFLGVNVGRVVSVDLDYDAKAETFPTVIGAVIYPNRLGKAHDKLALMGDDDDAKGARLMEQMVKHGLRAQARSANLLTGQLYISMNFVPNAKPVAFDATARPMLIPTVPGSLDKAQEQLQAFVDKLSKIPIDQIADNLNGSLGQLNKTLANVNGQVLPEMRDTLVQTRKTLATANDSFAEDSPQRQQLGQAMDEVQRTARSVRVLTDFLGRHPEALIRGRLKDGKPDAYPPTPSTSREIDQE
ncbi:intermembrane transport protein PqiB [Pseudomonas fluorescens]|uniref:PqiB family protein n=1 Tax=Pseudomonas fluorescens TaxID=294 RepID=UPI001BE7CB5F|nr:MlaD family protein [Pseudomonas fluorescens]MBT2372840.1 MCE family protein [Pseudomonas fluorescens]